MLRLAYNVIRPCELCRVPNCKEDKVMRAPRAVLLLVLGIVLLATFKGCATGADQPAASGPVFVAPPDFTLKGQWVGSFKDSAGAIFAQTMILEEQRDGEVRGRYIGYSGNEVMGGIRGKVKLPKITFTLLGKDFTVTLISGDTMAGWTWDSPGGGVPGKFEFTRQP